MSKLDAPPADPSGLGRWGEELACAHAVNNGYSIVDRNWRCARGELDIVCRHPERGLVVMEVKTRRSSSFVPADEAVSPAKVARLRRLTAQWLSDHAVHSPRVAMDLIAVSVEGGGAWFIRHIEDIG